MSAWLKAECGARLARVVEPVGDAIVGDVLLARERVARHVAGHVVALAKAESRSPSGRPCARRIDRQLALRQKPGVLPWPPSAAPSCHCGSASQAPPTLSDVSAASNRSLREISPKNERRPACLPVEAHGLPAPVGRAVREAIGRGHRDPARVLDRSGRRRHQLASGNAPRCRCAAPPSPRRRLRAPRAAGAAARRPRSRAPDAARAPRSRRPRHLAEARQHLRAAEQIVGVVGNHARAEHRTPRARLPSRPRVRAPGRARSAATDRPAAT